MKKCTNCIHYIPIREKTSNKYSGFKCECSNDCHMIGEDAFNKFEECSEEQKEFNKKLAEQIINNTKKFDLQMKILIGVNAIFAIVVVIASILIMIYALSNPELTHTQVFLWSLKKFWFVYIIIFIITIINTIIKSK